MNLWSAFFSLAAAEPEWAPLPEYNLSAPAQAGSFQPGFSIGGRVCFMNDMKSTGDQGLWFGAADLQLHLAEMLSLEAILGWRRWEGASSTTDLVPLHLSGHLYLPIGPTGKLKPYGLAGFGWNYIFFHNKVTNTDTTFADFGLFLGGGVEYAVGPKVSLNVDARYIWMTSPGNWDPKTSTFQLWMLTMGLDFNL